MVREEGLPGSGPLRQVQQAPSLPSLWWWYVLGGRLSVSQAMIIRLTFLESAGGLVLSLTPQGSFPCLWLPQQPWPFPTLERPQSLRFSCITWSPFLRACVSFQSHSDFVLPFIFKISLFISKSGERDKSSIP